MRMILLSYLFQMIHRQMHNVVKIWLFLTDFQSMLQMFHPWRKPGSCFLPAKYGKNICARVTFKMSLFHKCFVHFASKNQLPGLSKNGTLAGHWLMPFSKYLEKMWTVWKPAILHWKSFDWFLHNKRGVSEQTIVSLLMSQKVFQALISSDVNVNLWFSFPLWNVISGTLSFHLL